MFYNTITPLENKMMKFPQRREALFRNCFFLIEKPDDSPPREHTLQEKYIMMQSMTSAHANGERKQTAQCNLHWKQILPLQIIMSVLLLSLFGAPLLQSRERTECIRGPLTSIYTEQDFTAQRSKPLKSCFKYSCIFLSFLEVPLLAPPWLDTLSK